MTDMPSYNPGPAASFGQVTAPKAPPVMNTVFYMLIGAAVLQIIAAILGAMRIQSATFRSDLTEQLQNTSSQPFDSDMVDMAVLVSTGTVIVTAVVAVILYVLIGLFIKKGMGWARIVGAVLAVVSLSQLMGMTMPGGIVTILQVLLGVAAMVLCFTGPGAAYFAEKKNFKLANKGQ